MQRAEANLKRLMDLARCSGSQELEATIAASEQKADKRDEYERIAQGFVERNAAPDVREIEDEASGHHLDSLQSAIASSENRQKDLQDEVFKTGSACGTLLQEFERLQASDESTLQAQKAEDALGRVRPALAHYLRLQLASEVLQRAIESYREKHQGPVLNRASDLFSSLTLGDYSGLTTGFGDNDKSVLVAIRRNKDNVEIDGLSDGTRDQLYLALRLAAIEHHVETVSPCPVILDDILINADNARASATLKVLCNLASRTQVLFFTHHTHLVSIARSNPTAFQAVRFERPVRPSDNGEDGGIPTKRARGPRFEVSPDLVYEISLQDGDRKDGRACARRDTTDMRGAGSSDYPRSDLAGPHPHACGRASDSGSSEKFVGTVRFGKLAK